MTAWRVAKSLLHLRDQIDEAFPKRHREDDGTIAGSAHHVANPNSDHEPWVHDRGIGVVTALDITHDPSRGVDSYKIADHLMASHDPRIKYLISNHRIGGGPQYASRNRVAPWTWVPYHGVNPHDHHFHASVESDLPLYDDVRDWDWKPDTLSSPLDHDKILTPAPRIFLSKGDEGDDVAELQRALGIPVTAAFDDSTDAEVRRFQRAHGLSVDGVVGGYTRRELLAHPPSADAPDAPTTRTNIVATVFGGVSDPSHSAYDNRLLDDRALYIALPWRFAGGRPRVLVTNRANGRSSSAIPQDVGPWMTDDDYWAHEGARPIAETCNRGNKPLPRGPNAGKIPSNGAGVDLSPALAHAIGIDGMGRVDLVFVS